MKYRSNEQGFTAVEGVIIVLLIVLIGGVGFLGYQNFTKAKSGDMASEPAATATPVASSSTKAGMLSIPELKVELTLPAGLADILYAKTGTDMVGLTTKSLVALDSECTAANMSVGVLSVKASEQDPQAGSFEKKKLADGRYLYFEEPNGGCYGAATAANRMKAEQVDEAQTNATKLVSQALESATSTK